MAQTQPVQINRVDTSFTWYYDKDCLLALASWVSAVDCMSASDVIYFFEKPYKYEVEWCKYLDIHRAIDTWAQSVSLKCPLYNKWTRSAEYTKWRKSEERNELIETSKQLL